MTKFIGFLVFVVWTSLSVVLGYLYKSNRGDTIQVAETTVTCPESKTVFLVPYPDPIVVKESKQKNNRQIMLGVQNSGNVEARYNHPVSNNFGVYVGGDTSMNFSVGASFSF